jgi:hypothetical protein
MLEATPLERITANASVTLQEFIARRYIEIAQNLDRPQTALKALEILRAIVDGPDDTSDPAVRTQVTLIDRLVENAEGKKTREQERQVTQLLPDLKKEDEDE